MRMPRIRQGCQANSCFFKLPVTQAGGGYDRALTVEAGRGLVQAV